MSPWKLLAMLRAYRAGAPLGDVVVLKLDALAAPSASLAAKLGPVRGYAPEHDLAALRLLPEGTLGREYARFLDDRGIAPLVVSPSVRARFEHDPYALRYAATHDLHHLLAGFDTGLAGEAGVLAFNVGQGAAPVGRVVLWLVRLVYSLVSPSQARAIANNVRVGLAMGRAATLVMATPIEASFGRPLVLVRQELGIPDPLRAGVLPSGRSALARLTTRAQNRAPAL